MDNLKIIKLPPERWQEYKALRLEALQVEPTAFANSYEEVIKHEDKYWEDRLIKAQEGKESTYWFAEVDRQLVGMVGSYREEHVKTKHIAVIIAVYVKPEFRGKGIGKELFQSILDELENNPEIIKLNLDVNTTKTAAVNMYKSFGFEVVGQLKKELNVDGQYYDLYEMEKYLK